MFGRYIGILRHVEIIELCHWFAELPGGCNVSQLSCFYRPHKKLWECECDYFFHTHSRWCVYNKLANNHFKSSDKSVKTVEKA